VELLEEKYLKAKLRPTWRLLKPLENLRHSELLLMQWVKIPIHLKYPVIG